MSLSNSNLSKSWGGGPVNASFTQPLQRPSGLNRERRRFPKQFGCFVFFPIFYGRRTQNKTHQSSCFLCQPLDVIRWLTDSKK